MSEVEVAKIFYDKQILNYQWCYYIIRKSYIFTKLTIYLL